MPPRRGTALLLAMTTVVCALVKNNVTREKLDSDEGDDELCGGPVKRKFRRSSEVLMSNPSGLLDLQKKITLKNADGDACLFEFRPEFSSRRVVVELGLQDPPSCCDLEERLGINTDEASAVVPASIFDFVGVWRLGNVSYTQIQPVACPASGCPLVVEIAGEEGTPWLQVRYFCKECTLPLGVMVISPRDVDFTWPDYVNARLIPWVRLYVAQNAIVDKERVYLATQGRGNEIGLSACLSAPDIFSYALFNGKFTFSATLWSLVQRPGMFNASKAAGLKQLSFHVGDSDPAYPDREFYANFTAMLQAHAHDGEDVPILDLHIYPGRGHDIASGVWTNMAPVIWQGTQEPY